MRERDDTILADLIAIRAEEKPDLDVVTFEGANVRDDEVRTYAELFQNANRIAADLIAKGMEPGDRFAILIRNHPEFVEMMIAASISGCVFVPIDPRTRGDKLAYTIRNSGACGIYCADYSLAQVAEIRDQVPDMKWVTVLETGEEKGAMQTADVPGAENFAGIMTTPFNAIDVRLKGPGDTLQIVYTSGTTGDPKGVVLPNERFGNIAKMGPWVGLTPDDRPYTGLSLTHGNAQMLTLAFALGMGLRAVFSRKFTKSRLWDITRKYGCTTFNLLGGMATAIYSEPVKPDDADNPVRFVLS
ncbi:MAG: AMP-binding protein, partial [Rhodospirillales bacterium]|nr:AMP-binding protein [Rhodospirillales bacterium]